MKASLAVVGLLALAACTTDNTGVTVPAGSWGGANASLEVSETGATAEFKCGASGTLTAPLVLDASAHFSVGGTYQSKLVNNGPQQAVFLGVVTGDALALTIRLDSGSLGPFELRQGQAPTFDPCNF